MTYSLAFDYTPAYELFTSLYAYSFKKLHKRIELGPDWVKSVRGQIGDSLHARLSEFGEVWHAMNLLTWVCPHKESAESFLTWLDGLPLGEIYERLAPWVPSFPADTADLIKRHVAIGAEWNERYFRHLDTSVLERLAAARVEHEKLNGTMPPADVIEHLTVALRMEPTEELQTILMIPQYHCAPLSISDYFRGVTTILYPV